MWVNSKNHWELAQYLPTKNKNKKTQPQQLKKDQCLHIHQLMQNTKNRTQLYLTMTNISWFHLARCFLTRNIGTRNYEPCWHNCKHAQTSFTLFYSLMWPTIIWFSKWVDVFNLLNLTMAMKTDMRGRGGVGIRKTLLLKLSTLNHKIWKPQSDSVCARCPATIILFYSALWPTWFEIALHFWINNIWDQAALPHHGKSLYVGKYAHYVIF